MVNIKTELNRVWRNSAPLTATAILMLVTFVVSLLGIFLDHRIITGVPAWLKPSKFAISTAIYCGTLAWLFRYITVWPRFVRRMGWMIAAVLVLEVAIIDVQATRGVTSHFNVGTPIDADLFIVMGASILVLWLASIGILAALIRQKFQDSAWGWALRLGMLITVVGSATGGFMLRMTQDQTETRRATHSMTTVGGHTVGAPDGGPGLPGLGWSTEHGDLRIPHFFGLHGLQLIPILSWLFGRRRSSVRVFAIAASYSAFIAILTWQAMRGQSVVAPDGATFSVLAVWLSVTALTVFPWRDGLAQRVEA